LGKTALIVAGISYGLFRGLRAVGGPEKQALLLNRVEIDGLATRLDEVERAVSRLSVNARHSQAPPVTTSFVTREELAEAIDRARARIGGDLDRKFQAQSRAVNSLRAMVSETDVLLQRVLEGIENAESEAQLAEGSRR
jgi:hypothetical protein